MAFSLLASTYVGPGAVSSHMLFVLTFGVCVEIGKQTVFWVKGERRSHARETIALLTCAGCGLHKKVKKLSIEKRCTVLRY